MKYKFILFARWLLKSPVKKNYIRPLKTYSNYSGPCIQRRGTALAAPMTDGACWTRTVVVSPLDRRGAYVLLSEPQAYSKPQQL